MDAPKDARHTLFPSRGTLEIHLPSAQDTILFVGMYDLPTEVKPGTGLFLLERAKFFMEQCIPPNNYPGAGAREDWFDKQLDSWVVQVVLRDGPDEWWFMRLYGPVFRRLYYLLHWVGPRKYMRKLILPMMTSFTPLQEPSPENGTTG